MISIDDRYNQYDGPKSVIFDDDFGFCCSLGANVKRNDCVFGIEVFGIGSTRDEALCSAFVKLDQGLEGWK